MLRPDPGGDIGIQIPPRQERAMAVDMPTLPCLKLGHTSRVAIDILGVLEKPSFDVLTSLRGTIQIRL